MKFGKIGVLVILLTLAGCVTTPARFAPSKVAQAFPQRTPPDKVEVYRSQSPTKKFIEIGSVSVCCGQRDEQLELLRAAASESGGDALIGLDLGATGTAVATVIRYQ